VGTNFIYGLVGFISGFVCVFICSRLVGFLIF
jgi:hypothetical protein